MYDFHKVGTSQRIEFFHCKFLRGKVLFLRDIKRKKAVAPAGGDMSVIEDLNELKQQRDIIMEDVSELRIGHSAIVEQLNCVQQDNAVLRESLAASRAQMHEMQSTVTIILDLLKKKRSRDADETDEHSAKRSRRPPPLKIPSATPVKISRHVSPRNSGRLMGFSPFEPSSKGLGDFHLDAMLSSYIEVPGEFADFQSIVSPGVVTPTSAFEICAYLKV